jgi:predicted XRE-type DNA-binding protein
MKRKKDEVIEEYEVTEGSGNIFADLGLPNPEERLLQAQLSLAIKQIIESKGWTQTEAAAHTGVDQAKISALMRNRLRGFSSERLMRMLMRLGRRVDVRISAREYKPEDARITVGVGLS